jgi:hypothetical protein
MTQRDDKFRVRNGFLTRPIPSHTRDAFRLHDEMEEEEPDDETVEIHNHIPISYPEPADYDRDRASDDEEQEGREGEVARYPANAFTVNTEDDENGEAHHVVYRSPGGRHAPPHKTDRYEMGDATHDNRPRPPRTLAQLNRLHAAHYKAKAGRR